MSAVVVAPFATAAIVVAAAIATITTVASIAATLSVAAIVVVSFVTTAAVVIALCIGGCGRPGCRAQGGDGRNEGFFHNEAPMCAVSGTPSQI
ncbi:MAG: hypothetical protein M0D54_05670 [Hyphomonadaceae bacterium JAD_PAG50586_4]|nr:MAG: hypothetical protein M0D54_05670 [Hyphomonadaceae bacterium JAD_PAG50586_4]